MIDVNYTIAGLNVMEYRHSFLTLTLNGAEWSELQAQAGLTPNKNPSTRWIGGLVEHQGR